MPRFMHLIKMLTWFVIFMLILFCGCSPPAQLSHQKGVATGLDDTHPTASMPEYRIGYGDIIKVKFFRNEQFTRTQPVRPDGRITLERVGDLDVVGLTPSALDSIVTTRYKSFVLDPEITVFVEEFGSRLVYVMGEVDEPGVYPLHGEMTPLQAIAAAGGETTAAKLTSVILMRRNGNGEIAPSRLDLRRFDEAHAINSDYLLQPRDVIYVPKTLIGNVDAFMNQLYSALLPPIDAYLRALFWYR